jgi:shikimate dehydrogenase
VKKWYAVIGDPIKHSKSPEMHSFWYDELKVDASYVPIHVKKDQLETAIQSLQLLGASGFNVTIPHKEAIIPFLDELDPLAKKMGAVNTVVRLEDGRLKGYNTDGAGFVKSLEAQIGEEKRNASVLIIGAGGAARGIAFALKQQGYHQLTIANRTIEKAQSLITELGSGSAISLTEAEMNLQKYEVFIQTTPAGLNADEFSLPFSMEKFPKDAVAADIVYNPLMTPFLLAAEKKDATIINGLGMFVHQGAIAFEHWLGIYPPSERITSHLVEQLK